MNARIKRGPARVEPEEASELAEVAHELKQESVHEAVSTECELGRGRTAARISQVVDYIFYLIYGLIALEFLLGRWPCGTKGVAGVVNNLQVEAKTQSANAEKQ